jgi:hypothetical protein
MTEIILVEMQDAIHICLWNASWSSKADCDGQKKDTQQEDDLLHFEVKSLKAERRRYTCTLANAALIHIDIVALELERIAILKLDLAKISIVSHMHRQLILGGVWLH